MIQWLYAVGSNGLVGFVEWDVVEDCLVDGAFERRRRILGRYLSELERGEAAATPEARIEGVCGELAVVDAVKLCA